MPNSRKLQGPGESVHLNEEPALWKKPLPSSRRVSSGSRLPLRQCLRPTRRSKRPGNPSASKENLCPSESSAVGQENLVAKTQQEAPDCQCGRLHPIR